MSDLAAAMKMQATYLDLSPTRTPSCHFFARDIFDVDVSFEEIWSSFEKSSSQDVFADWNWCIRACRLPAYPIAVVLHPPFFNFTVILASKQQLEV